MKKLLFMFAVLFGMSFVSCGNTETCECECACEGECVCDTVDTLTVDTVAVDTVAVDSIL